MNPQLKQKRTVDKKYLKWIRTQPCLVKDGECYGDVCAHHTTTRGAFGSDREAIPLCMSHHQTVHNIGLKTFQKVYEIDFQVEIEGLNKLYDMC